MKSISFLPVLPSNVEVHSSAIGALAIVRTGTVYRSTVRLYRTQSYDTMRNCDEVSQPPRVREQCSLLLQYERAEAEGTRFLQQHFRCLRLATPFLHVTLAAPGTDNHE